MKVSVEIKADMLKIFIQEDRTEIRLIRDRVFKITSSIIIASFAISAFLFGKDNVHSVKDAKYYSLLVDTCLIFIMIISFIILKKTLYHARRALRCRQNYLINLDKDDNSNLNPFKIEKDLKPDVTDNDLSLLTVLAVILLIIKILIGWLMFPSYN